jgi:hypothetical protein
MFRYKYADQTSQYTLEDVEKAGLKVQPLSLEEHYEKTMAESPPEDDYVMVRGPRPWEENQQAEKVKNNKKIPKIIPK